MSLIDVQRTKSSINYPASLEESRKRRRDKKKQQKEKVDKSNPPDDYGINGFWRTAAPRGGPRP